MLGGRPLQILAEGTVKRQFCTFTGLFFI